MALCAALLCLRGSALLYDHSLHSIDGAMQTWFALSHFAQGEQLGHAFQSYLGVTMILALLPVFWAMGETLYASTFAAYVAVFAGAFGSAYAIAWMISWVQPGARWMVAVGLVFVFYLFGSLVADGIGLRYPLSFDPGVSLRPVRGALVFAVMPVFVIALRAILRGKSVVPAIALGGVTGLGLLWSNDAGIPLVIAVVIALTLALFRNLTRLAKALAFFTIGTAASAVAVILLVTHGEPGGWLRYNFVDVAGDQFWYFAPWDRATRILGPLDLTQVVTRGDPVTTVSLLVLLFCLVVASFKLVRGRGSPVRLAAFAMVGASTVGTSLIPQIGGHVDGSYNAITFMLGLAAPLVVFPRLAFRFARRPVRFLGPKGAVAATVLAALALIGAEGARAFDVVSGTERTYFARNLGFYVTPEVGADLQAMERLARDLEGRGVPADRQLLSVYTSVLDIAAGSDNASPVGSLIHALGARNREQFTALVEDRQVAAVTTIAPDYSGWEGWNLRANWPFFEALRNNYHPIARSDQQVLWVTGDGELSRFEVECEVSQPASDRLQIRLTAPRPGLASVRLDRSGKFAIGRTAMLTVTEDSPFTRRAGDPAWTDFPRYGVPNAPTVRILAPVEKGSESWLTLAMVDGSDAGSARCSALGHEPIDFDHLPTLPEGIDAYLESLRS